MRPVSPTKTWTRPSCWPAAVDSGIAVVKKEKVETPPPKRRRVVEIAQDAVDSPGMHMKRDTSPRNEVRHLASLICKNLRSDDESVVVSGLNHLFRHCTMEAVKCEQNCVLLFVLGGHLAIIQAMELHPNVLQVQIEACRVLAHLTAHCASSAAPTAVLGGITAILRAMACFSEQETLQQCACEALMYLTENDSAAMLISAAGISLVVKAMRKFPKNSDLQLFACGTVGNLCENHEKKRIMEAAGGLSALALENTRKRKSSVRTN